MLAQVLTRIVSLEECDTPLQMVDLPIPEPRDDEVRVRVAACGVCHTELDEIEGRMAPPRLPVIPGHEVVGYIDAIGGRVTRHRVGDRVGVGWIYSSSGGDDENISDEFRATGRDVNGGYAEYMTVPAEYAYSIPECFTNAEAAPLLCAGAVGYRALRLTGIRDGQSLGLTGFGGSAHLVLQLARHQFPNLRILVFARDPAARAYARQLGADWTGDTTERAPKPLHAIIDTTPAWKPVVEALANLRPGGRLVINAIRKEDTDKQRLLDLTYHDHLWLEREMKSVANVTRGDIESFLALAAEIPIRPEVATYPFENANQALIDLKRGPVKGAKVLLIEESTNLDDN
jgi:propanol-preferring alcohol dehydrogenase